MKHTPGPWKISDSYFSVGNGYDPDICFLNSGPVSKKLRFAENLEHIANARLIAAAPELLEALKDASPWLAKFIADRGEGDHHGLLAGRILAKVAEAIARAEGE